MDFFKLGGMVGEFLWVLVVLGVLEFDCFKYKSCLLSLLVMVL